VQRLGLPGRTRPLRTITFVQFLDPRATPTTPVEPYDVEPLPAGRPVAVGLLANGFPDSVAFLDAVEIALADVLAGEAVVLRRYAKPNASAPLSPVLAGTIVAECDALVTAYGH
jgi:hypothetical protein